MLPLLLLLLLLLLLWCWWGAEVLVLRTVLP